MPAVPGGTWQTRGGQALQGSFRGRSTRPCAVAPEGLPFPEIWQLCDGLPLSRALADEPDRKACAFLPAHGSLGPHCCSQSRPTRACLRHMTEMSGDQPKTWRRVMPLIKSSPTSTPLAVEPCLAIGSTTV